MALPLVEPPAAPKPLNRTLPNDRFIALHMMLVRITLLARVRAVPPSTCTVWKG